VNNALQHLQSLGRALMLPIAVLPVAALLLRLGQPDLLGLDFVSAAGNAMFANLGLLFAIGVATGFAKDGNGAAPLAGVVCFLVATEGAKALLQVPADVAAGVPQTALAAVTAAWRSAQVDHVAVPLGIVSGIVGGLGYNRFSGVKPPEYLAFFGAGGSCRSSLAWPGWRSRACSARRWAASMPVPMPRARRPWPAAAWACSSSACSTACCW
jgi:PTS system N-acetylglucosamine-specific IIC component